MKPTKKDITVESNFGGEEIAMRLDENSTVYLMNTFIDLYSDPVLAILREISTNALDSHIEAGNPNPISVSLPSRLNPVLSIKDEGVGLDRDDIFNVYSLYGASTKRNTNSQSGMLGLGCKSPLTYTSQFTVIGIKNKIKTIVSVSRDEDGAGKMTIVNQSETDEPNGVEVIVPVREPEPFHEKAEMLFAFWEPGTVLIDGKAPAPFENEIKITDRISAYPNRMLSSDYLVQGNIPYPIDFREIPDSGNRPYYSYYNSSYSLVFKVDIGEADFTPNRELIHYTTRTKKLISDLLREFLSNRKKVVTDLVDSASSKYEAAKIVRDYKFLIGIDDIEYKGEKVPNSITNNFQNAEYGNFIIPYSNNYGRVSESSNSLSLLSNLDSIFIKNFSNKRLARVTRDKIFDYLEKEKGIKDPKFVLVRPGVNNLEWINQSNILDWEDIKAYKFKSEKNNTLSVLKYSAIQSDRAIVHDVPADIIREYQGDIFWCSDYGTLKRTDDIDDAARLIKSLNKVIKRDFVVICLATNRLAKFKREFPDAVHYKEAIKNELSSWWNDLSDEEKRSALWTPSYRIDSLLSELTGYKDRIKDPSVKEVVEAYYTKENLSEAKLNLYKNYLTPEIKGDQVKTLENKENSILDKYPLLAGTIYSTPLDHAVDYINVFYEKETIK